MTLDFLCCICTRELNQEQVPAIDYRTGGQVCVDCTRVQRHVARKTWLRVPERDNVTPFPGGRQ